MRRLVLLLTLLVVGLGPSAVALEGDAAAPVTTARGVPSRAQWLADVRAAMTGFGDYVRQRVAAAGPEDHLAVNFDIDNTVIATYYDGGGAIPVMRRFARMLHRHDVAVLFNTGRLTSERRRTVRELTKAGYPVDGVCLRTKGATLAAGKQRCRAHFADEGYTLIANVGNNDSDFEGGGYDQAYRLPNYGVLR